MAIELDTMAVYAIETGLMVRDAEKSLHFYCDVLGLEPYAEIFMPGVHVWGLRLGNSMIKLLQDETPPQSQNPRERSIGFRYITIHVTNIEDLVEQCRREGYEIMTPPSPFVPTEGPSGTYAYVLDPDGNWVELSQGSPWVPPTTEFRERATSVRAT